MTHGYQQPRGSVGHGTGVPSTEHAMGPGKRTLVEQVAASTPVQRKGTGSAPSTEVQAGRNSSAQRENRTGMPDQLKSGIEALSGMSMDHVQVHRDSSQPAAMNALAYAQDSDIYLGPGQERHLPHEAWHVVQQAQGRVQPTRQMKRDLALNEDPALEHEADVMGSKAMEGLALETSASPTAAPVAGSRGMVQRLKGAPGTKQANQSLAFTINDEFIEKHVASDLSEAKAVTEHRLSTGAPPAMVKGALANHMASQATWISAINASTAIVPPEDDWSSEYGNQGPQFVDKLAELSVDGFKARVKEGKVVAQQTSFSRYVGGHWQVTGCEDANDGSPKAGTGIVTMDITHLTS